MLTHCYNLWIIVYNILETNPLALPDIWTAANVLAMKSLMYYSDSRSSSHEIPGDTIFLEADAKVKIFSNKEEYIQYRQSLIRNRLTSLIDEKILLTSPSL